MWQFICRRLGLMFLTALSLTFIVFFLTNLQPNLEKLAKTEGNQRMSDIQVESWLDDRGYNQPLLLRYGEWLGIVPGYVRTDEKGKTRGRCIRPEIKDTPSYCGLLQGSFGYSTTFDEPVGGVVSRRLGLTGILMFWVMIVMVPMALIIGILAGIREGSKTDRTLSTVAIGLTATPEYISGVILSVIFASTIVFGERLLLPSSQTAMENITFSNFTLPVMTMVLYGMGYIARMTRASMAEVMTAQYIRTARLKGVSFANIVVKHALRNALIAPFTVIMLQFPWLLTGVVIVETLFNYKGFGWLLVKAADTNDIELLLSCSVVAVVVVLVTQLISDIGYVFLNPRIRVNS